MSKLKRYVENNFNYRNSKTYTELDPTYGETFSYFGELVKQNKYYILGLVILGIIANLI